MKRIVPVARKRGLTGPDPNRGQTGTASKRIRN